MNRGGLRSFCLALSCRTLFPDQGCRWLVALTFIAIGVCGTPAEWLGRGFSTPGAAAAAEPGAGEAEREGQVTFAPSVTEADLPARFRLDRHSFGYREEAWLENVSRSVRVSRVTFPSPLVTESEPNNTVHCEYFRPRQNAEGPVPGVVVLHILGGDFSLARAFCNVLSHQGVAALFVKMPYYGPRRAPGNARRMITLDPEQTLEGMTQAVLDVRRATAWLASREEIDSEQLGVLGISLGGITGALAAAIEPRLKHVCLLLAGGNLGAIAWESPEISHVRRDWEARGGTREDFARVLSPLDPCSLLRPVEGRRVLMLNARHDRVIPKICTVALWEAFGRPEIVWYDGDHYSVGKYLLDALYRVVRFYTPPAL